MSQLLSITFDLLWVFALLQKLGASTASIYEDLICRHLSAPPGTQVLDIGCGIGAHRKLFWEQNYLGVGISASRIELASRRYGAVFEVMDASKLDVRDTSVDLTLCCDISPCGCECGSHHGSGVMARAPSRRKCSHNRTCDSVRPQVLDEALGICQRRRSVPAHRTSVACVGGKSGADRSVGTCIGTLA